MHLKEILNWFMNVHVFSKILDNKVTLQRIEATDSDNHNMSENFYRKL